MSDAAHGPDPDPEPAAVRRIVPTIGPDRPCHRCEEMLLLWANDERGRPMGVCGTCDVDDPYAGPIATYFAVHGNVQEGENGEGAAYFAGLLLTWAANAEPFKVDLEQLEREYEAYLRGEL